MNWLQFGNDEDVNIGCGHATLKVQSHGFANVFVKLVDGLALREDVFPDPAGAPKITVVIDFHLH